MKKFTLFLASLFLTIGAMAQISALSELDNSKAYLLKNANDMGYAIWKSGDNLTLCGASSTYTDALDATDAGSNWQIISYKGEYYLYNIGAKRFAVTCGGATYLTETPTSISIETVTKGFAFNSDGVVNHYMCASHQSHHSSAPIQFWYSSDNGSAWQIIDNSENITEGLDALAKVEEYVAKYEIINTVTPIVESASDTRVGAYTPASVTALSAKLETYKANMTEENHSALEEAYNELLANGEKVTLSAGEKFTVKCFDSSRGYMVYSTVEGKGSDTNVYLAGSNYTNYHASIDAEGIYKEWALIVCDGKNYIYNVEKKQFIQPVNNVFQFTETPTAFSFETVDYTVWALKFNSYLEFSPGYNTEAVRTIGNSNGVGAQFYIDKTGESVSEDVLATIEATFVNAWKDELSTLINAAKAYTFGTKVGEYTQAAIEETLPAAILAAEEAYDNATTATQAIEATKTLQNVIDNLAFVLPSADKFYKIVKFDDATKVVYIENGLKGNWGENTTPASVWAFEQGATDGKFYLRNVGTGSYINGYAKDWTIYGGDKKDETSVILYDASKRQVGIAPNDGEHFNRASGRLCAWTDYYAGSNSAWLIEEVTEFAHTLTVGAAGYTTLVLGYNATVPAIEGEGNGVFTATVNGEWIDLTAVAAGSVLPANTAVIIKAAADTELSFAYNTEAAAEVTTDLSGTLYDKNVAPGEGNTAYVLSNVEGVVGFYKATLNKNEAGEAGETHFKNNANKAYLVVENASPASLSFRFPGTTGVEEITDNREQSTVIYDLTGRRVEAITAPGIYIVNGKKTLVK